MTMRLIMPSPEGRGAGLGNEMNVWAKAIIAAHALGGRALHPAWGINKRNYRQYFGTSRFDWAAYRALAYTMPGAVFDEAAYAAQGVRSLAVAVDRFIKQAGLANRSAYVLQIKGMWGGADLLAPARLPLLAALLAARNVATNLFEIDSRIPAGKLRIAVHVRRGDFDLPVAVDEIRGKFNVALPLEWYVGVVRTIVDAFGDRVHILIVSDASEAELAPLLRITPNCTTTSDQKMTDISDMLAVSFSDFIVCSVSSFSMWAVLLSSARYAWYEPQLSNTAGLRSIWGHEPAQQVSGSETLSAVADVAIAVAQGSVLCPRGISVGNTGALPAETLAHLENLLRAKWRSTDLLRYGVVPSTNAC